MWRPPYRGRSRLHRGGCHSAVADVVALEAVAVVAHTVAYERLVVVGRQTGNYEPSDIPDCQGARLVLASA